MRKLRKYLLHLTVLIFFAAVGVIIKEIPSQFPQFAFLFASPSPLLAVSPQPSQFATPSASVSAALSERAFVSAVVDGDTIHLKDGRKLRYIGIDTPETVDPYRGTQCFGKQASDTNKELVLGKEVRLEKDVSETDKYGRLLRYVYVEKEGKEILVNESLVLDGFAFARTYPPDVKYQEKFRAAEKIAREKSVGIWSSCPINESKTGYKSGVATKSAENN